MNFYDLTDEYTNDVPTYLDDMPSDTGDTPRRTDGQGTADDEFAVSEPSQDAPTTISADMPDPGAPASGQGTEDDENASHPTAVPTPQIRP